MDIVEIANVIKQNGGTTYLVGGAVRDAILNKPIKDEDYCVTGLTDERFIELFPNARTQGKSFQVFVIDGKEFALARKETKIGKGHKEFKIESNENISIEEDLKRRDITINSIAQNVLTKEIIDPFKGQEDLENRIIRETSSRFSEDPLRVYRVARMAAVLDFKVSKRTLKLMSKLRDELETLSKERVFAEFKKALEADKPSIFFDVLRDADVLDVHFKEIYDLIGAIQPVKYHPEGDSYNHTMLTLNNCAKITKDIKIRFCALVHDLGKGRTPKEMYPHHYNHEQRGVEPLKLLCKRIGCPKEWQRCAMTAVLEHMKGGIFWQMTIAKKVGFIEKIDKSALGLKGLQYVVFCDRCREYDSSKEEIKDDRYNFMKIGQKMIKEVNGDFIIKEYNLEPGIEFGRKLHEERIKWLKSNIEGVVE